MAFHHPLELGGAAEVPRVERLNVYGCLTKLGTNSADSFACATTGVVVALAGARQKFVKSIRLKWASAAAKSRRLHLQIRTFQLVFINQLIDKILSV